MRAQVVLLGSWSRYALEEIRALFVRTGQIYGAEVTLIVLNAPRMTPWVEEKLRELSIFAGRGPVVVLTESPQVRTRAYECHLFCEKSPRAAALLAWSLAHAPAKAG